MGKKSTPASPDYEGLAREQGKLANELLDKQTLANRPNQNNPWGSIEWEQDDAGNWTQNTTLNEDQQRALDAQQGLQTGRSELAGGMLDRVGDELQDSMDWSQYGDQQGLEFDPTEMRQKAEDAAYNRATSRLDPRFEQDQQSLEIKLRGRGLSEGDAAYDSAMQNFNQSKNDAYENAQNTAVGQGRGESAQLWQQQQGAADYANKLRQNSIQEEMTKRGFSLNELNSLISGQQIGSPNFAGFSQANQGQAPDLLGAGQMQSNFDQAQHQSAWGGMGDLATTAGMFAMCDRRLKKHIKQIGKYLGYPLYIFEYIWGEIAVGVMADEVNHEAVSTHCSGYSMVDYSKLTPKGE